MDIDEEAFRQGALSAKLYGYLTVPFRTSLVQNLKMASAGGGESLAAIAEDIVEGMEDDCLYIIGPGTTTRAITAELGLEKTLLGVDVIRVESGQGRGEKKAKLIAADANEAQLLALLDDDRWCRAKIIVTPIGGQGYLFGRGNQQISPRVIKRVGAGSGGTAGQLDPWDSIIVAGTKEKLYALGRQPLLVDTGDQAVDQMLSGYTTVVTGYRQRAVRKVSS
jgi:predicted polyphosphate/ATP-dependent NAD kinase